MKSPNDANDYRYLVLDNQLRTLLISDPSADKAAASLNITVGSGDDPVDREGLSHFLEHMLFLGTEKYPDPGEYQQFIRSHGGTHNAFTAFQDTNYFFDIQPDYLEQALDRFAQQFSAPLFTPELVERERRAVHSEFTSQMREDSRRNYSARQRAMNPAHPASQFSVGNMHTLEDTAERPLQPDVVAHWHARYSANIMTLVVYGPQSLDELEAMVRPRFTAIENRNLAPLAHDQALFDTAQLPRLLEIQTLREVHQLNLSFPIPSQRPYYRDKPLYYLASILGNEGPGSLLDVMKQMGWVESLSAGQGLEAGEQTTFEISLALTPQGFDNWQAITAMIFKQIDTLRQDGITETRFAEKQQLAELDFRFAEKLPPVRTATRLSMLLHHVDPENVLRAPWMLENYRPDAYRALLAKLTPDNVLVTLAAPRALPENTAQTRWYSTPYQLSSITPEQVTSTLPAGLAGQLALPAPNPFVPENLDLVAGAPMNKPLQLNAPGNLALWYARDTRFGTPRANIYLSLRSPVSTASPQDHVLNQLLVDSINVNLNPIAYAASLAGLEYRVYTHLRGITIKVGGYDDKLHRLLGQVLLQVAEPRITEARFETARQRLMDNLRNNSRQRPFQQASQLIQNLLLENTWTDEEKLAAAEQLTVDDLRAYAIRFATSADPVMLVHGNLTEAAALNLANQAHALVLDSRAHVEVPRSQVRRLGQAHTPRLQVEHPDTGFVLYVQGANRSYQERAIYRLLSQIASSPFYESLRTQQQLGYVVYASPYEMLETPALGFTVQSPEATGEQIDEAVARFAEDYLQALKDLSDDALAREKRAVISRLMERERRLDQVSERYWREIDREAFGFDSREQLAAAVDKVSREQLVSTWREAVIARSRSLLVTTEADSGTVTPALIDTFRGKSALN
ncbi:MAG: insulinase family protein [Marinobacter sp.]|nr:insulinase family protein [Marinobacter sp.]